MLAKGAYAARGDLGGEETLGEAHRPKGQGRHALDEAVFGQHQFERATADVHHDRTAGPQLEVRQGAAEAEQGFLLAAQDPHAAAGEGFDLSGEIGAVGGITHGARGHDLDPGGSQLASQRHHALNRRHGRIDGRWR